MIDILVFSHSCLRRANRLVYNKLHQDHGFSIKLIVPMNFKLGENVSTAEDSLTNDIPIILESLKGTNPRIYFFKNTFYHLRKLKPKIVFLDNDPISLQAMFIGIWCKIYGTSLVCLTCENIDFTKSYKSKINKKAINSLFKKCLSMVTRLLVHHVFTINNAGSNIYKNLGFRSVTKIPLGFDPSIFYVNDESRARIRNKLNIEAQIPIIAYIGRISYEKGIHVLLKSLAIMKEYDWVFMLDEFKSTKTPYHHQIIQLINELNLNSRVYFVDAKHLEIADYMNAADVVVIPSISTENWVEQYGRVAPESMACQKIIVASNTGALPELLGDTSLLIPENDEQALRKALVSILLNPDDFNTMKLEASERSQKFSIENQARLMSIVFKNLNSNYENFNRR